MWSSAGWFLERLMSSPPIDWLCLILIEMDIFSWRYNLRILLSLHDVMTWILMHLPMIYWFYMDAMNCCTVVGSCLTTMRIHTLFFQVKRGSMGYYLLTGIHSTYCDAHSIRKLLLDFLNIDGEPGSYSTWPIWINIWLNTDYSNNIRSPQLSS